MSKRRPLLKIAVHKPIPNRLPVYDEKTICRHFVLFAGDFCYPLRVEFLLNGD